jgi:hypothetical protein
MREESHEEAIAKERQFAKDISSGVAAQKSGSRAHAQEIA